MPTTGALRWSAPAEPWNVALPKVKMPPSEATSQYPPSPRVSAIPTMGAFRCVPPMEPRNGSQNEKTPPSEATIR